MLDADALADAVLDGVKAYVDSITGPLLARNAALEGRIAELEARPVPEPPVDDIPAMKSMIEDLQRTHAEWAQSEPSRSRGYVLENGMEVFSLKGAASEVEARVAALESRIPAPDRALSELKEAFETYQSEEAQRIRPVVETFAKSGLPELEARVVAVEARPAAEKGDKGDPGADADPAALEALVAKAVDALPKPKDGEPGKDGIGLADGVLDQDGAIVLIRTDGTTKTLGIVKGKDGLPGKDGRDGIGTDDKATVRYEGGGRWAVHEWERDGEVIKSERHKLATVIYRGVYVSKAYDQGDSVTFGGSQWIAMRDTTEDDKPGIGDAFQLSNKKGRDGKDGKDGVTKEPPKPGPVKT